ncbi:unnamed protein product [Boreogadus saida]
MGFTAVRHSYNKGDYEGSEQQGGPPYMGITSGVITLGTIAVYSIVNFPTVRARHLSLPVFLCFLERT